MAITFEYEEFLTKYAAGAARAVVSDDGTTFATFKTTYDPNTGDAVEGNTIWFGNGTAKIDADIAELQAQIAVVENFKAAIGLGGAYTPPVPKSITRLQFLTAAGDAGIITKAEALAAAQSGAVPASIAAVFATLSESEQFSASVRWATMTIVPRNDPLVAAVATSLGMTSAQVDAFFITAAAI